MLRKIHAPHLFCCFLALPKASFLFGCTSWNISLFHKILLFLYLLFFHYVEVMFLENHNFTDCCDHTLPSFIFIGCQELNGQYHIRIFISLMLKCTFYIKYKPPCDRSKQVKLKGSMKRLEIILYILWLNKKSLASSNSNIQYTCLLEYTIIFFSYF